VKHAALDACPEVPGSFLVVNKCERAQAPKKNVPYLQHDMGRTVPAIDLVKITWQAGCLTVRANVDVGRRTIDTVETSAHYVLLTAAGGGSARMYRRIGGERPT
jgi:hypothetical protein